ncbi:MAG TPA: hypothetical protein VGG39_05235 [Polyangiaceae bacterium]
MFEGTSPELLEATRPYLPHFRFLLDDLSPLTATELASRALDALPRLVELALWASRSLDRLLEAQPFMRAVVARLVWDHGVRMLFEQVTRYVHATAPADVDAAVIQGILLDIGGPKGEELVMNSAEQLRKEGEERGREVAREGIRGAIAAALSARGVSLSGAARDRIVSCGDVATLTRWLMRAVTAASEADVFVVDGPA